MFPIACIPKGNTVFNPNVLPYTTSLEGWWDFSDASTITIGTGISAITDKSGNGRTQSQATGTAQPSVATAVQNGRNGATFDGVDDFLASGAFTLNKPTTVYFVEKLVSWTINDYQWDDNTGDLLACLTHTASPKIAQYVAGYGGDLSWAIGQFGILTAVYNGASSTLSVDGGTAATGTMAGTAASGFRIANYGAGGPGLCGNTCVGEVLLYSGAHSATIQGVIRAWLKQKWATP